MSGAPDAPFSVVRVQVERLPNKKLPPRPLWLAWIGGPLPADLSVVWRWYLRRFTVEHAFRFFKQTLGWTTVRPRHAEAANRWSWLIAAACWQLWLARPLVSEVRLPWEHPRADGLVTPGQVHRRFSGICSGSVLRPVHLESGENRPDVVRAVVRSLHSTTKWPAALRSEPRNLPFLAISCPNFNFFKSRLLCQLS